jgi:hypothetical protein
MQCNLCLPVGHRLNLDPPHHLNLLHLCSLCLPPPYQLHLLPLCFLHLSLQPITHTHCNSLPHALLLVIRCTMGRLHLSCHWIHTGFVYLMALIMMTTFQSFPPLPQFLHQHPLLTLVHNCDRNQLLPQSRNILLKTHLSQALENDRGQGQGQELPLSICSAMVSTRSMFSLVLS